MKRLLELNGVDADWEPILLPALETLEEEYRGWLMQGRGYHPEREKMLAAFSTLRPSEVRYILFGQDPYPRVESATGYAFIDGRVKEIFSSSGLSKEVNRAVSLRNFIKMALVADGLLDPSDTSQAAIASLEKTEMISTMRELRSNFEKAGVLLLNTALVFSSKEESKRHIKSWRAFVRSFLGEMGSRSPRLILFGAHAGEIRKIPGVAEMDAVEFEHPFNHSFVFNSRAHAFFGPMRLMRLAG